MLPPRAVPSVALDPLPMTLPTLVTDLTFSTANSPRSLFKPVAAFSSPFSALPFLFFYSPASPRALPPFYAFPPSPFTRRCRITPCPIRALHLPLVALRCPPFSQCASLVVLAVPEPRSLPAPFPHHQPPLKSPAMAIDSSHTRAFPQSALKRGACERSAGRPELPWSAHSVASSAAVIGHALRSLSSRPTSQDVGGGALQRSCSMRCERDANR